MRAAHLRLAMQRERGLDARWATPAQAAELLALLDPERILGATFCEQDGAISPPRNVAAYLVMMREHGVRLRHHVFVTSPAPELAAGPLPMGFDVEAGLYWRQEEGGLLFGISDPGEAPGEARGSTRPRSTPRASTWPGCCR